MINGNRKRLVINLDGASKLCKEAKDAVEYMEKRGIDVKKAAFAQLAKWKKTKAKKAKKFSSKMGVQ